MNETHALECLVDETGGRIRLLAPEVGTFTCAVDRGQLLVAGATATAQETALETAQLLARQGRTDDAIKSAQSHAASTSPSKCSASS